MRLLAYPEIGQRITISQGRERTRRNRHCEKRSDEAIQGTQGARDSWIVRFVLLFFRGFVSAVRMAGQDGEIDPGWNTSSQAISIRRPAFAVLSANGRSGPPRVYNPAPEDLPFLRKVRPW